ncbi:MAG: hypothetical protein LBD12_05105 [Clostridiales Family XIII bacterium]|nr:hypothetical protein [Clostridiales Family XIII bacterium]
MEAQLSRLNAKSEGLSQELCAECGREMQRLTALLSQMISEDQAHHAAEAAAAAARG